MCGVPEVFLLVDSNQIIRYDVTSFLSRGSAVDNTIILPIYRLSHILSFVVNTELVLS